MRKLTVVAKRPITSAIAVCAALFAFLDHAPACPGFGSTYATLLPLNGYPEVDSDGYVTIEAEIGVPARLALEHPFAYAAWVFRNRDLLSNPTVHPVIVRRITHGKADHDILTLRDNRSPSCDAYQQVHGGDAGVMIGRTQRMPGGGIEIVPEAIEVMTPIRKANIEAALAECRLPKPSPDRAIIGALFVSSPEGQSPVSVSDNLPTRSVTVKVEEGNQPIYAILGSERPVIWVFEGAVHRIQEAVLSMRNPQFGLRSYDAGAVGLNKSTVQGLTCLPEMRTVARQGDLRKIVRRDLGQEIAKFSYVQHAATIRIPSMTVETGVPSDASAFKAANVVGTSAFRAADDVAQGGASNFYLPFPVTDVERLVFDGKLEAVENLTDQAKREGRKAYRMLKPIDRLPDRFRDTLIVPNGFNAPRAGMGCLVSEATGDVLHDRTPRSDCVTLKDILAEGGPPR